MKVNADNIFAGILRRSLLPPFMRQAFTVLIPKKSKGSSFLTSDRLRPMSLLTTNYKLLARIVAKRMEMALKFVVGDHQTSSLKDSRKDVLLQMFPLTGFFSKQRKQPDFPRGRAAG